MRTQRARRRPLVAALLLLLAAGAAAEEIDPGAFDRRIDEAWARVDALMAREARPQAEALQRTMAEECWAFHVAQPDTATGDKALVCAFQMWRNVGQQQRIAASLDAIDPARRVWYRILPFVRGAYLRYGLREEYVALFERLQARLQHPMARSEALRSLADDAVFAGDTKRALGYYRRIIEIGADRVHVDHARAQLHEHETLAVGAAAPPFEGVDLFGRPISLSALKGRVVLLEFWATFCAPCIPELDNLVRLRQRYSDEQLVIVGISFDRSRTALKRFLNRRKLAWPQLCDGKGDEGEIARLYNAERIPRSFVIDREGRIVAKDHRADRLAQVLERSITAE